MTASQGTSQSIPKGVANDQEGNINLVGIGENLIAGALDLLTVCLDNRTSIESFLLNQLIPVSQIRT